MVFIVLIVFFSAVLLFPKLQHFFTKQKIIHINFKSKNNNKRLKILFFADNPYKQTIIISSSNKQQAIRVL